MLKSSRLTTLLSQSLAVTSSPIETFDPESTTKLNGGTGEVEENGVINNRKNSLPAIPHTHRIVMAILLTSSGNLLAASSISGSHATPFSLALTPSVSQMSASGNGSGYSSSQINGMSIHMSDLSPKPRVYASYAANAWKSYLKTLSNNEFREENSEDIEMEWIILENEESSIIIHSVSDFLLLVLVGEREIPSGLLYGRASAMASILRKELDGFTFD
ncbi:hypothetical protein V1511DRAFT_455132 [Dipodascopsis uninucleata]